MNKYRSAMDKVEPPKELSEKTVRLMEHAQRKPAPQKRHRLRPVYGFAATAACLLILLTVPTLLNNGSGDIFITELEAGIHIPTVELADGVLVFEETSGDIFISPGVHAGIRGAKEEWEIARYEQYIGTDVSLPYLPDGFSLKEESATVYLDEDGEVARDHYQAGYRGPDGGELTVSVSGGVLPEGSDYDVPDNSSLRGEPLYADYDPADGRYHVQFMREGIGYLLEARGISQEEFIMIVWRYFE